MMLFCSDLKDVFSVSTYSFLSRYKKAKHAEKKNVLLSANKGAPRCGTDMQSYVALNYFALLMLLSFLTIRAIKQRPRPLIIAI